MFEFLEEMIKVFDRAAELRQHQQENQMLFEKAQLILKDLKNAYHWTNTKPIKPGWYWFWDIPGGVRLIKIIQFGGELCIDQQNYLCPIKYFDEKTVYWAGPIPIPEIPEGGLVINEENKT